MYFFQNLCRGYNLLDHILGKPKTTDDSSSQPTPPTAEWLTIDSIVLTWIFITFSKTFQQRLVVENPQTEKEAWDILALIFNDNKHSCSIALKAELRSMKLGDLSIDAYFRKIKSIATILSSTGSPISNDDVVNIALDGLPDKYHHVSDIIIHWDPFPDLKTDPTPGKWNMDTSVSSHLNDSVSSLSDVFNSCIYPSVSVGDEHSIPVTNSGHSILPTPHRTLYLNNVLIAPNIDFLTRWVLLRCDSLGDLYVVTKPSTIPHAFLLNRHPSLNSIPTLFQRITQCNTNIPTTTTNITPNVTPIQIDEPITPGPMNEHVQIISTSEPITPIGQSDAPIHTDSNESGPPNTLSSAQQFHATQHLASVSVSRIQSTHNDNPNPVSVHPMVTHFRVETNRPTQRFTLHVSSISPLPKSYSDAFNDPNWKNVMSDEYNALIKNNTWTLVPRPTDANIVEGIDVDETFSAVVKPGTIRTVLSLATSRHWPVHQLDVNNAFLHGDLSEKVYMHQPPGFRDSSHRDYVCLLQRSLYRLKQASRAWFQRFAAYITRILLGCSYLRGKYVVEILERAHMFNCNPSRTPVDTESKLGDDGDLVSDLTVYQSLAGSLQYLTFTALVCSWYIGLWVTASSTTSLVAYSDADWAGCPTTRRLTFGYCIFLGNNLLSWSSKHQPTLSCSSVEAENRGVANAVAETCWLRNLLHELHTPLSSGMLVYCDNVSATYSSSNLVQHQRTKHIEIDIHFARDLVVVGQVRVLHVPSRFQYADIFTKGLLRCCLRSFVPI
ncbi:ribonuclease H-like domain-containing protein [Tanacetum coccineum]